MDVVAFDLDSTACNTLHRRHIINTEDRTLTDWVAYSMACADDTEGPAFPLVRIFKDNFIVVSRRDNEARQLTDNWFKERDLHPLDMLLLKDEFSSDERDHGLWKVAAIRAWEARTGNKVILYVDDRLDVRDTMFEAGIPSIAIRDTFLGEGE